MSFAPGPDSTDKIPATPETLFRVPVGLSSPLWGLFAGAAMSGAAWWWMTRWARPENLEAMFGAAEKFEAAVEPKVVELARPVVEAAEAAPEAVRETEAAVDEVSEVVVEAAQEPVLQAPVAETLAEAAPVSPVLAVLAPEDAAKPTATLPKSKKAPASKPA
jgi:hypothetical protein